MQFLAVVKQIAQSTHHEYSRVVGFVSDLDLNV
jgi:hypothetical protein